MEEQIVRNITDKPNSLEIGSSSNRHKIYYSTVKELKEQIQMLKDEGLWNL